MFSRRLYIVRARPWKLIRVFWYAECLPAGSAQKWISIVCGTWSCKSIHSARECKFNGKTHGYCILWVTQISRWLWYIWYIISSGSYLCTSRRSSFYESFRFVKRHALVLTCTIEKEKFKASLTYNLSLKVNIHSKSIS